MRPSTSSFLGFLCLLALFVSPASAQTGQVEGKTVADIQFWPEQPLAPADLERTLHLKRGAPLRAEDVASSIDSLFATGRFEDLVVEAVPTPRGVIVRFVTKLVWFVGGIDVEGSLDAPPNRGQVVATAGLALGTPFSEAELKNAVDRVNKMLQAEGFFRATVVPRVNRGKAQQAFITLTIEEGPRAKYAAPIITGQPELSEGTIVHATGWRLPIIHLWRQVTESRTRNGVTGVLRKYQQQNRLTARVEVENLNYVPQENRVRPTLHIQPGPKVDIKTVETKVSRRVLKRYVPAFQLGSIDAGVLTEGQRNLSDYFQAKGYFDVDVNFRIARPSTKLETVEYVIARGPRQKLVRVDIRGNKYFSTDTLRERMFMQPAAFLRLRHGRYSEVFRRKDEENITSLYKANGFLNASVTSTVQQNYRGKRGEIAVTVSIVEGTQTLVSTLALNGVEKLNKEDLIGQLALVPGQPFSQANAGTDRSRVLTEYYTQGFPDATFRATWQPSAAPNRMDVIYTVQEGDRKYVRDVLVSGLKSTRPRIVERTITIKPGDPLSTVRQTDIQRQFYNMGIFARVSTAVQNADGQTDHKYVLYNFDEANRYVMAAGFGLQAGRFGTPGTSLSAPAGSAGISPAVSFSLSRLNSLGLGHTATFNGTLSTLQKRASLNYLIPGMPNAEDSNLSFSVLYDNSIYVNTFTSKREEGNVQYLRRVSKPTVLIFRFTYRRDNVSNVVIPVLLIPLFLQSERIGMVGANYVQDRRNNPADPRRGMYNSVSWELASTAFGSQVSFNRVLLRNATYTPLSRTWTFARQTQLGVISPFAVPSGIPAEQIVPLPERFYAGGADSLRAFPFNQAGPRDIGEPLVPGGPSSVPTGFPLGGNALFINNLELRFPFIGENMGGVLFHDMGNVFSSLSKFSLRFNQRNDQDFNYTTHAVGFGIRYRTPIGPIRLDLAYSINPPSFIGFRGNSSQVLQCNPNLPLSQLPSFCQPVKQNVSHFQFFFSIGQMF